MITFGYAKEYRINADGTWEVKTRIPSIHGPYKQSDANGRSIRNYVTDAELPWIQSLILPKEPTDGDVVAVESVDNSNNNFLIIGLTGAKYAK